MIRDKFQVPGAQAIASYDYIDIAEGTGIVEYNAFTAGTSGAETHHLSTSDVTSNSITVGDSTTSDAYVKEGDYDFDLVYQRPKLVAATTVYVAFTLGLGCADGTNGQAYAKLKLRKYSGTTETDLATAESEVLTRTAEAGGAPQSIMVTVPLVLTSRVHFKKGDTLRVTIETYGKRTEAGSNLYVGFGADPANRDDDGSGSTAIIETAHDTTFKVFIPYVLD